MTKPEILTKLDQWVGNSFNCIPKYLPLINFDLYEGNEIIINRMYYIAIRKVSNNIEFLVFYSDNTFSVDNNGDLTLTTECYHWPE